MRLTLFAACLLSMATPNAYAQGLSLSSSGNVSSNPLDRIKRANRVIDGRLSEQYSASVRLLPNHEDEDARSPLIPRYDGPRAGEYVQLARVAARNNNVPEDLFLRLVHQESRWNAGALSHKGAIGLAQLMPSTAELLRVDPNDPGQNLDGGARYLRMMYERFGNWRLALAAYNAGPGAVEQHGGVPPFAETRDYVAVILGAG